MYTLLVGKPPFETSTLKDTYKRIKQCEYRYVIILYIHAKLVPMMSRNFIFQAALKKFYCLLSFTYIINAKLYEDIWSGLLQAKTTWTYLDEIIQ